MIRVEGFPGLGVEGLWWLRGLGVQGLGFPQGSL